MLAGARVTRKEIGLALSLALLLAAWLTRGALFDPARVLCALDVAAAQEPWASVLPPPATGERRPAFAELSDQALFFYPQRRFVADALAAGELPLWNPAIAAGAPALGNPQVGVLDPEVLLLALFDRWGGRALFDWGLAFLTFARLAAAVLGAYLLARNLGLSLRGAALAALGFAGSGFGILWQGASLAHVGWTLPWLLLALERLRARASPPAFLAAALLTTLAILGGHPETAFFVGASAAAWSLSFARTSPRAALRAFGALAVGVLCAAPAWMPFLEYVQRSGALVARRALPTREPDWFALGLLALALGVAASWRRTRAARHVGDPGSTCGVRAWERWVGSAGNFALAALLAVAVWQLALRGLGESSRVLLFHDAYGDPSREAWRGGGHFLELASPWVAPLVLVLAASALFQPGEHLHPRLCGRTRVATLAALFLLLALELPGLAELYRLLPFVGHGALPRAAVASSLFLALLAGEALDSAARVPRIAAAAWIALLALAALWTPSESAPTLRIDADDELVAFRERPQAAIESGELALAGWIGPEVPALSVRLALERLGEDSVRLEFPLALVADAPIDGLPPGARGFCAAGLDVRYLPGGAWSSTLELLDSQGQIIGRRAIGVTRVERSPRPRARTLASLALALGLAGAFAAGSRWSALVVLAALAQVLLFAEGKLVSVERASVLPPTATERVLRAWLTTGRYLGGDGALDANLGLALGLPCADGYDALDLASYDALRVHALKPGEHPLLGFDAQGVDLGSRILQLLGVELIVSRTALAHPKWRLAASPRSSLKAEHPDEIRAAEEPVWAELYVLRSEAALPLGFCVGRTRPLAEIAADPLSFQPAAEAWLDDGATWTPTRALSQASVSTLAYPLGPLEGARLDEARFEVELDGDALFVFRSQRYPGWEAEVDGAAAELLPVDGIYSAVSLGTGRHQVTFRYRPRSLWLGVALAVVGLLTLALLGLRGGTRGRVPRARDSGSA